MNTKRMLLATLLVAVFINHAAAQGILQLLTVDNKQTSFGGMAALPVGKFASTSLDDGGFARQGFGLYFDSKTVFKSGLTFISHSTYAWVPLNQDKIAAAFTRELGRPTKIEGGRHAPFMTSIGLGFDIHRNKFIKFGVSAQLGLLYNSFRAFDITVYDANNQTVLFSDNLQYDSHFSPAYLFGAQLGITLIPNLVDLQIIADYSSSSFKSSLRGDQIRSIKTTQQIQILNVGGGLVFHVKK